MYGDRRIYGYISGGSGGSFQVIASLQSSSGVWDGGVPYVMGTPQSIPNVFTIRIHALRVLKGKFPQIMDAIDPGGSGDMYAGLNEEEQGALKEATLMGFPPGGWFDYPTLNGGPLALVAGYVPKLDPNYVDDFWTKPGYLGTDPRSSIGKARIRHDATVVSVTTMGPLTQIKLSSKPDGDLTGADLVITSGAAAGKSISLFDLAGLGLGLGARPGQSVPLADKDSVSASGMFGTDPSVIASLKPGDKVRVDNSWYLALQQAPRDLSAWVEKGVQPPDETSYKIADSQVEVPANAAERKGIQPVVELNVNGGQLAEVAVGQPVTFTATIETPPKTGKIVAAEWDFEGAGNYPDAEKLTDFRPTVTLKVTHTFSKPGTYFSVLRATSQREGDSQTPYARIQNLARVRVVVK